MESDFGRMQGERDVVRSLATLAYTRSDRQDFPDELIHALVMLQKGEVGRARMKGSWAGAMGGPQFMPSAYLKYAVSFNNTCPPDIWTNSADTLASIAHFFQASGWRRGLIWGSEVILPADFDYASLRADFSKWTARGLKSADGSPLPASGEATLFFPAGASGPAFLLSENYWILKAYNNSDSYALSLACLAERIAGQPGLHSPWPNKEKVWSRTDKTKMQQLLGTLGLYAGEVDGRFGPASRQAIHAFQRRIRQHPADGYPNAELLDQLKRETATR
jgi:lytic murein transglycosylase